MSEPVWLERRVVDAIHLDQLQLNGGLRGVKDDNALESALARPKNRRLYEPSSDLATLAAAYGYALATSHAYSDGNKRTAFAVMGVYLLLNELWLDVPEPEAVFVMLDVAERRLTEQELAAWLRANSAPAQG